MSKFDREKDIIKNLEFDPNCNGGSYTNEDRNTIYKSSLYSDGTGKKDDLYENVKSGDLNKPHDGTHVKSNNSGEYTSSSHNENKSEWKESSGTGCYLTTACMKHMKETFDDNCYELRMLRWFRDKFVSKEDKEHYYITAPIIVEAINNIPDNEDIYDYIYQKVILKCIEDITTENYESAYARYKNMVITLEEEFARPVLEQKLVHALKNKRKIRGKYGYRYY